MSKFSQIGIDNTFNRVSKSSFKLHPLKNLFYKIIICTSSRYNELQTTLCGMSYITRREWQDEITVGEILPHTNVIVMTNKLTLTSFF